MHNTTVTYIKKDGVLVPENTHEAGKLKLFNASVKEGEKVEMYLSLSTPSDKTIGQLAKVHAAIRELASFTGHNFDEIKEMVKKKSGLFVVTDPTSKKVEYKSFADCSKDELSKAIESCIEIGSLLGYDLN